jgi:hypothetical protein
MTEYREDILKEHARMKAIRAIEEPHWREIAAFLRPDDRDFDAHVQRRRDDSPIFTIEPILAVEDFEGGFFSQASNPMNRWGDLGSGDEDLDKYQPVKAWMWRRSNQILGSFTPSVSAFYSEVSDWYAHICCFGWGGFYSDEVVGAGMFNDAAIPINESFIGRDAAGRVNRYHREFSLTGDQAKAKKEFRDNEALGRMKDEDRAVFVHAVFQNPDYRPGAIGPRGMAFTAAYVSPDLKEFYEPDGYYEFPYGCPRWRRRSGRPYPTGIGHTIRADVVMVNEMERSNLVAAQFIAEPTFLAHEKSDVLAADIEPNAVLYGTMNAENGKQLLGTLDRHQNLPVSLEYVQAKVATIRKAVRFGLTQLLQRPQMTATEFLGFQEEDLKLMGPGLVRVQNEGLSTIFARRYNMLDRAGLFDGDPPPPELVGKKLTIKYNSPLAKMMKVSEARGAMQFVNALLPIKTADPNSAVLDNIDMDAYAIVVHDGFTSDPSLLMDPKKRDAMRAQRAAAQQAIQQAQLASQVADVHATVAHANQAQTLSAQRRMQ